MVVFHVKVKDYAICENIGKIGYKAEGSQVIQGTEIGKECQRNKQREQVYSSMGNERERVIIQYKSKLEILLTKIILDRYCEDSQR